MQKSSVLDNISIVLVDTKTPANIGATSRCMMNMGLSRLILVNPPTDDAHEAARLSAGANGILTSAKQFSSLAEAIADHTLVIGTSRHAGKLRRNMHPPRETAALLAPLLMNNRVAIVFGNEVNGLDNNALALCQEIIAIPSDAAFPSLNLSHAVMIVAYELFLASRNAVQDKQRALARAEELERFFQHLHATLQQSGFFRQEQPERLMFTFRQMFGRARLTGRDVQILRGVLSMIERLKR